MGHELHFCPPSTIRLAEALCSSTTSWLLLYAQFFSLSAPPWKLTNASKGKVVLNARLTSLCVSSIWDRCPSYPDCLGSSLMSSDRFFFFFCREWGGGSVPSCLVQENRFAANYLTTVGILPVFEVEYSGIKNKYIEHALFVLLLSCTDYIL